MKVKSKMKEQKGSITLYVLLSMLFFVTVLVGLYVNSSYKMQQQQKSIQKIQQEYEKTNIDDEYNKVLNK